MVTVVVVVVVVGGGCGRLRSVVVVEPVETSLEMVIELVEITVAKTYLLSYYFYFLS